MHERAHVTGIRQEALVHHGANHADVFIEEANPRNYNNGTWC